MEVPSIVDCTIVVLIGPVSCGKSWLMSQWFRNMDRAIAIDTTAELLSAENCLHVWANPRALASALQSNPDKYRIAYHPKDVQAAFYWSSNAIWQLSNPRWLITDEVHEVCSVNAAMDMSKVIIRYSRHNMCGFIGSSQRLADVSRLLTSNARQVVLFRTDEAADLDAIYQRWGATVANRVQELRPCIYKDAEKIVEQTPECIVIVKGLGYRVYSLGDKVKTMETEEEKKWLRLSAEAPEHPTEDTPVELSSVRPSGRLEQSLKESTSEVSLPE